MARELDKSTGLPARLDPAVVFKNKSERREANRKLAEHKWTLEEVRESEAEAKRDNEGAREHAAMKPFIAESNRRGDFKYPWQYSRKEATQYLRERGIEGEPYSTGEIRYLMQSGLYEQHVEEITKARQRGQIITGPGTMSGTVHHFPEDLNKFGMPDKDAIGRNIRAKLKRLDQRNEAAGRITEALEKSKTFKAEGLPPHALYTYLHGEVRGVEKLGQELYPVDGLPGMKELRAALKQADLESQKASGINN